MYQKKIDFEIKTESKLHMEHEKCKIILKECILKQIFKYTFISFNDKSISYRVWFLFMFLY